ncbi:unnamed protein product, partial [Rotaria magnacalcarata]
MCKLVLQNNIPLGFADLGLLATVGLRTIHAYDQLRVVVLSTDSGKIHHSNKIMLMSELKDLNIQHNIYFQCGIIYNNETSIIQTLQFHHPIIRVQL